MPATVVGDCWQPVAATNIAIAPSWATKAKPGFKIASAMKLVRTDYWSVAATFSPPLRVQLTRYASLSTLSETNRTDPSAMQNWAPPGCRLRKLCWSHQKARLSVDGSTFSKLLSGKLQLLQLPLL